MVVEEARQYDMFSGDLVDTRSRAQRRRDTTAALPSQGELFSQREIAQFGVSANPQMPLSPKTRLELAIDDPRSEEEKDRDRMKAAEASTYGLFDKPESSSDNPRLLKLFPSGLSFDMSRNEEPEPHLLIHLTEEVDLLLESTRDAAYDRAREVQHLAGHEIYQSGDRQLDIHRQDGSGTFRVTYSDMDTVDNIEWVEQANHFGEYVPASPAADVPAPVEEHSEINLPLEVPANHTSLSGETTTPVYRQYDQIKKQFPDAIVLFRLGDFYEAFSKDAETLARELDVVLTSRMVAKDRRISMAGVPYQVAENYITRLIARGYHVAVCEQIGDEPVNGLIPREVVRVVTSDDFHEHTTAPAERVTWEDMQRRAGGLSAKGASHA
jgi:hypothetical protein